MLFRSLGGGVRRSEPRVAMTSRRVAPVGAQSGGNSAQLPFFGSILQMQLAKGLQTPYFEDGVTGQILHGNGEDTGVP